jgi:hypothetical protein
MIYSETKQFVSEVSLQDLIDKINAHCKEFSIEIKGISHDQVELEPIQQGIIPPAATGAKINTPIYIRSTLYTAIIFYSQRK